MNIIKEKGEDVRKFCNHGFLLWLFLFLPRMTYSAPPPSTNVTLNNPLSVNSIEDLLEGILGIVVVIATPIVIFFIIYAGFLYVTAQGDETKLTTAKKALTYAIIGGVLILGAYAIGEIIKNLVSAFTPPPSP
ncbi:MAG: pilin [Candidatus Paceibacterota bacterium]